MKNVLFKCFNISFSIFLLLSCAQITSLNLKKHQFGQLPTKIIWIQVAGLNEEHLALLKYSFSSSETKTSFENFLCVGKAWEYNLFNIRPTYSESMLAQITGKKNIKGSCEDYNLRPIWSYMVPNGYKAGIFEGEMQSKDSFAYAIECNQKDFLKNTTIWKMQPSIKNKTDNLFHLSEKKSFKENTIYYDRSCLSGECFSTFSRNIEAVYSNFAKNNDNHIFIIRNTKFLSNLLNKNISKAKEELGQIAQITSYFQNQASKRSDTLILLTAAAPLGVEFPRSGKEWERFEALNNYNINKHTKLISTVMASGARAENFCGIFEQSELMTRIFSGAKQQGLELAIINPFN